MPSAGVINGVQGSNQNTAAAVSAVVSLVFSRPDQFPWLMVGSTGCVLSSALLYTCVQTRNTDRYRPPAAQAEDPESAALICAGASVSVEE